MREACIEGGVHAVREACSERGVHAVRESLCMRSLVCMQWGGHDRVTRPYHVGGCSSGACDWASRSMFMVSTAVIGCEWLSSACVPRRSQAC